VVRAHLPSWAPAVLGEGHELGEALGGLEGVAAARMKPREVVQRLAQVLVHLNKR